jgi:hypothetical protein
MISARERSSTASEGHNVFESKVTLTATSSFASIIDIILQQKEKEDVYLIDLKVLRCTCKFVRAIVDSHVQTLTFPPHEGKVASDVCCSLREISPWPWHNLIHITLGEQYTRSTARLQEYFEALVTIPLPKLQSLGVWCQNAMPIVNMKYWPSLTNLELNIPDRGYVYPENLQFPDLPCLKLKVGAASGPGCDNTKNGVELSLGPLLKSCKHLTDFIFQVPYETRCSEEVAEIIVSSAPVGQMEYMKFQDIVSPGFFPKLFSADWPSLVSLIIMEACKGTAGLLSSQTWLKNLVYILLEYENSLDDLNIDELSAFLKCLETGVVEYLNMKYLTFQMMAESFKGISLQHLKRLDVDHMYSINLENGADVSNYLNVLFDSCSFPNLEALGFGHSDFEGYADVDMRIKWQQAPRTRLFKSFPNLKEISLLNLNLSVVIADYLGDFHRKTGCQLHQDPLCHWAIRELTESRVDLLTKLDLNYEMWIDFCHEHVGTEALHSCIVWGDMSDKEFKRIAYAQSLLQTVNEVKKLERFIGMVEAEEQGSIMTADVLKFLKENLDRWLSIDYDRLGVEQCLSFKYVENVIDYKMLK